MRSGVPEILLGVLIVGLASASSAQPLPAADPAAGAVKAATCGGCHGPDGNSPNPVWPKLAGQQAPYLEKQLRDFQAARRSNPMMSAMAAPLSPQDIVDVASYFSSLPLRVATPAAPDGEAERLYREGRPERRVVPCASCHGLQGEGFSIGMDGGFPAIGGQNAAYLQAQLRAFRDGTRANDEEGMMQLMAGALTDEDIATLAAYLASLPRVQETPVPARSEVGG